MNYSGSWKRWEGEARNGQPEGCFPGWPVARATEGGQHTPHRLVSVARAPSMSRGGRLRLLWQRAECGSMARDGYKFLAGTMLASVSQERLPWNSLCFLHGPCTKLPAKSVPAVSCCVGAVNASVSTVSPYGSSGRHDTTGRPGTHSQGS
jgi:hypothetical protein